ncbi:MAG: MgtC/SapB family protein [Oscillospiraceae bacterium]|nr:MgtC/SapB family protein [Oscillospiraceae bacterium]
MLEFRDLTLLEIVIRILVAIVFSGIIGLERGLKNRAAGFRTYMLVCLGSCVIMLTNQYIYQATGAGDPVRMGAQVVSGIGFLGAGTIIVTKRNQIKGLTTAAGLWASACIGLAVGIGFYEVALVGAVAIYLSLTLLHTWEDHIRRKTKVLTIYAELKPGVNLGEFLRQAKEQELVISNTQLEHEHMSTDVGLCLLATVKSNRKVMRVELLEQINSLSCLSYMEEL